MSSPSDEGQLTRLARSRWRVALALTAVMLVVYFGFILAAAFGMHAMGQELVSGLSWGILLGAAVIVVAFLLTGIYVHWANAKYDPQLRLLRGKMDRR